LRDTLTKWLPDAGSSRLLKLLRDEVDSSQHCSVRALCDALSGIARRPDGEEAYRNLLAQYAADSQFVRAESAFMALSNAHRESVWPRKILSEIEHENLSATNPAYFAKSYENALIVRRLPAYRDMAARRDSNYRRIETDIAEVALSAGAYGDLQSIARAILRSQPSPTETLNMTLFLYFASAFARETDSAAVRLARLDAVVDSLPPGFNNLWEYPGTRAFIRRSALAPAVKKGLLDLCREGPWYTRAEAKAVIQENRQALRTLRSGPSP
jgi:hypothetical protein